MESFQEVRNPASTKLMIRSSHPTLPPLPRWYSSPSLPRGMATRVRKGRHQYVPACSLADKSFPRWDDGLSPRRSTGDSNVGPHLTSRCILTSSAAALRELEEEGGIKSSTPPVPECANKQVRMSQLPFPITGRKKRESRISSAHLSGVS
jgi:hypothetical protein